MTEFNPREVLDFLYLSARLKSEVRHCCDASGERPESVAEHCFLMTLFAFSVHRYLEHPVDVTRLIKLCICHDLAEAVVGDTPFVDGADTAAKRQREREGLRTLVANLPAGLAQEITELWEEFEDNKTLEARCAKALDNLEAQLQHNIAPLSTWEEREFPMVFTKMDKWCAHDAALQALCEAIKADASAKMRAEGRDPAEYVARVPVR
jgi:putative hydrolase of HD superfamily